MQIKRSICSVAMALCLLLAAATTSANAAAGAAGSAPTALDSLPNAGASSEAGKFVQANIDKGFLILNNMDLDAAERQRQFREFLFTLVDTKRIALFTLGPYARQVARNDLEIFLTS